jgi:predicted double-glycine peptidase
MGVGGAVNASSNPKTLNTWLKSNGGYVSGSIFVWKSIEKLGLAFRGFIANDNIKSAIDEGNIVLINVRAGSHWALAFGYNGDNVLVNDPKYVNTAYPMSDVSDNKTAAYEVVKSYNREDKKLPSLE